MGGRVEEVDHLRVDQAVHLHGDGSWRAGTGRGDLALDEGGDAGPQGVGRHEQRAVADVAAVAGEEVEEVGQVVTDVGTAGEQPEVLVGAGRLGVVVAGADVAVATYAVRSEEHTSELPSLMSIS